MIVRKNESGVTLVELLAVLALISIVTAIIWNTIFISMKHNTTETKKTRLQQEANYVIAEIQRYHRQCDSYGLTIQVDEVTMKNCVREIGNPIADAIISNGFRYESLMESGEQEFNNTPINTKTSDSSLTFKLTVKDSENDNLEVNIPTTISRYKGNEEGE